MKKINNNSSDYGIHIMNHSSDKIFVLDHDYCLKYFNPSAQKFSYLFGIDKMKLGINMLPKRDLKFWKKAFDQALSGEVLEFKKEYLIKNDKYSDLMNIYPIRNTDGEVTEISIQAKNYKVEPFIQKELLEHEKLFQSLMDTSPNGVTIRKFKTQQLLSFNLRICELFNCTPEEFRNNDRSNFVFYENSKEDSAKMKLLGKDWIENFKIEKLYRRRNGDVFWGRATRSIFNIGEETYQIGILEDISMQKKFEKQLIENEAKVKSIFNSTKDKIFAVDKNYNLIDSNQTALKILATYNLNQSPENVQITDINLSKYNHWKLKFDRAFEGEEFNFEEKYEVDGKNHFDLTTVSPLKNASEEIIGATVYGKEITKLKNSQKELAQSEAKVRAILNSTNDKIFAIDPSYKLIEFNDPAAKVLPVLFEKERLDIGIEMLAQNEKSRSQWIKLYNQALKGERVSIENEYTFDGITKTDIITLSPILNIVNEVIGVTVFGKEITDLQNTKLEYRNLFEDVVDAIVMINKDRIVIDCNTAAQKLLGYSKKELSKIHFKEIIHPDDQERSRIYLNKLIANGYYSNYQGRIITKKGEIKYIQVNSNAVYENGEMIGSRDIVRDITPLKKDKENRIQLISQLAEVNKELKDFAHIVSHDLKAPLRAIKNIATWLSEDYKDKIDVKGKTQLQLLVNRVNRMYLFINGIFEYTKIGRTKETKEIVAMEKVIQDVNLMLNLKKNVKIDILQKLPEIYSEKIKIEQVFQNLISNAVKYNDKKTCLIEIDYEDLDSHYLFRIKDNGKGIEEKNFEKIFQIFQTLQPRDDFESTGIGLSIVKRIVQLHGGEINVKSKLGEYTIFELTIKKYLL